MAIEGRFPIKTERVFVGGKIVEQPTAASRLGLGVLKSQSKQKDIELKLRGKEAGTASLTAKLGAVRTGISLYNMITPILITALIIIFIVGPAGLLILDVFQTMNLWVWGIILVGAVFLWRRM